MRIALVALLAVVALSSTARAECADPVMFGAVPNDGVDDAPEIREALAATGEVCLGPGVWDLGYAYSSGSVTVGPGQIVRGTGPATVLRMSGDAHAGTWFGVTVQGGVLSDLAVTQSITNPDPAGQNHLVRVNQSDGSRLERLALGPGSVGGGDCIQLLGNTADITGLVISDVVALGCERSAIAIQHGVASGVVTGVVLNARTGSEIDYEPTSPGPTILAWSGAVLLHTSSARALTMSDSGGTNRSTFVGMMILGGNVQAVRASGVTFTGNVIVGSSSSATSTLEVIRDSVGLRVFGNLIVRPAGVAGTALRVVCNQGLCPSRALLADNVIEQSTAGFAIETDGLQMSTIRGNVITTSWTYAIKLGATIRGPDVVAVEGNVIESTTGGTGAAIYLAASTVNAMGRVLVMGNVGRGFSTGVLCANLMSAGVRITENLLGSVGCLSPVSSGWNQ